MIKSIIKQSIPIYVRRNPKIMIVRRNWRRWAAMLFMKRAKSLKPNVFYGWDSIPAPDERAFGGIVKFQHMQHLYPNSPRNFNVLYMVSSALPADCAELVMVSSIVRACVLWNQNGVAYPASHGPGWEQRNRPAMLGVHAADHVVYQSQFCKVSADRYLGVRKGTWEILYNAVDTSFYTPSTKTNHHDAPVILSAGTMTRKYRFDTAAQTIGILVHTYPNLRWVVGRLGWADKQQINDDVNEIVRKLGIERNINIIGPYNKVESVRLFQNADVLLHTQYNDACPTTVIEAMSCGLPVVYSQSGGTPELVGDHAGIGVPAVHSWEQIYPPDPKLLAEAVSRILEDPKRFSDAARQRATEMFDLKHWLDRHNDIFVQLLEQGRIVS